MSAEMQRFWDRRAREDAFYFVDNRLSYRRPDLERFWTEGERDLDALLGSVGASLRPDDRVVEIGCGVGRLTRVLAARCAAVQAVDISPEMLRLARTHNPGLTNVQWRLTDGARLDGIPPGVCDACVSHVVFQHIPDPEITLGYVREIGRVLRPGGWAAFQISNDPRIHRRAPSVAGARDGMRALVGLAPRGQRNPNWLGSMVGLDDLRRAAADGAMEVECVAGEGTQFCCVLTRRL